MWLALLCCDSACSLGVPVLVSPRRCLLPPGRFPENGSYQLHNYRVFKPSALLHPSPSLSFPRVHTHSRVLNSASFFCHFTSIFFSSFVLLSVSEQGLRHFGRNPGCFVGVEGGWGRWGVEHKRLPWIAASADWHATGSSRRLNKRLHPSVAVQELKEAVCYFRLPFPCGYKDLFSESSGLGILSFL